ncbi:uncharacterized protein IUM83_01245 [Phytophthora cinnamomi]|uniref:uncharacterized protein n=1 Tax=Phytophthora cinnamomi TaxID=4785 RepID=UPI00355AB186|nr:hypothetical protein IUM83_01245 [Phytophthora cinnamomi]
MIDAGMLDKGHHIERLPNGCGRQALLLDAIADGACHSFRSRSTSSSQLAQNHKSTGTLANVLRRSIREDQDAGAYLIVDIDVEQR